MHQSSCSGLLSAGRERLFPDMNPQTNGGRFLQATSSTGRSDSEFLTSAEIKMTPF